MIPSRSRPNGIPISRAIIVRPGIANDDLRLAIDAVNRVHGDGELSPIPTSITGDADDPLSPPSDGRFWFDHVDDGEIVPLSITVKWSTPNRSLVLLHEIGHLLDACGMPEAGFASLKWDGLRSWRRSVVQSAAFRRLSDLADAGDATAGALLPFEECWARSYAQVVAIRSGLPELRTSLDRSRHPTSGTVYYPRQWSDDDFVPIEGAIIEAFRRLAWIA